MKEGKVCQNGDNSLKDSSSCNIHLQVNVSVDEGLGLPVIEPVTRQAAGGGAAEERKNQVRFFEPLKERTS